MSEKKIGIITFHGVYNYGAVIQAYALQKFIESKGYHNEIINFSPKKQVDYTDVFSTRSGIKRLIKTLLLIPVYKDRTERKRRFKQFFNSSLTLSARRFGDEDSLKKATIDYSTFIIGSDQVWNTTKKSDTSSAYFLRFAGNNKKIAYAPSIGVATEKDLRPYKEDLAKLSAVSCREKGGAALISNLIKREVKVVLDPTLLVDTQSLMKLTKQTYSHPYILYYSLDGYDKRNNNMDILTALKTKFSLDLKIIMPEWPFHRKYGEDVINVGPEDFLTLIRNAVLVCTNSFHGTALAIKFERPLYVLEDPNVKDERKSNILQQLCIEKRHLSSKAEVDILENYEMDYSTITKRLELLRKDSSGYLLTALGK